MKRYLFLILLTMSIAVLLSVESDPSATVGYFKNTLAPGDWFPFGLPFGYPDLSVDAVMGLNYPDGTTLQDFVTGEEAIFYNQPGVYVGWDGIYGGMTYGSSYWLNNASGDALDFFILGKVDPSTQVIHVSGMDEFQWSPFTMNEARPVAVSLLNITGAYDGDSIQDLVTGEETIYYDMPGIFVGWDTSTMEYLMPTHVFWYYSNNPDSFDWTYVPAPPARDAAVLPAGPSRSLRK